MAIFEIINATDSLVQNIIWIVWLIFDILTLQTLETMLNYAHQFIKVRLIFHPSYLWKEANNPQFLFHFWNK